MNMKAIRTCGGWILCGAVLFFTRHPAGAQDATSKRAERAVAWARSEVGQNYQPCETKGCKYNRSLSADERRTAVPCKTPTRKDDAGKHARWFFWCARFVANAYGAANSGYASAHEMYEDLRKKGRINQGNDIPVGALVFWECYTKKGERVDHVGLYLPGGEVVHTGLRSDDVVRIDKLEKVDEFVGRLRKGAKRLGWAAAPDHWPGRAQ